MSDSNAKPELKGEKFKVEVKSVSQDRFDKELASKYLTEEQLKASHKTITFDQMKTKRHAGDAAQFRMPNLANATVGGLVDMLGDVREEMKILKKLEGVYKQALAARAGLNTEPEKEGED